MVLGKRSIGGIFYATPALMFLCYYVYEQRAVPYGIILPEEGRHFWSGGTIPHMNVYTINNTDICTDSHTDSLLVYVYSAPSNVERRDSIRTTWAREIKSKNKSKVIFLIGVTEHSSGSMLQSQIEAENRRYGDIVQGAFVDSYTNLTFKAVMALHWIGTYCNNVGYALKVDDDVLINVKLLQGFLNERKSTLTDVFICYVHDRSFVKRMGKNAVSFKQYPYYLYPKYCQGSGYMWNVKLVKRLYNATYHVRFLYNEDVYITGILPHKIGGITYVHWTGFQTYPQSLTTSAYETRSGNIPVVSVPEDYDKAFLAMTEYQTS